MKRQRSIHSWRSFQAFSPLTWERLNSYLRARDRVKKRDIQKQTVRSVIINLKNTLLAYAVFFPMVRVKPVRFLGRLITTISPRKRLLRRLLFRRFPAEKEIPRENKNYLADSDTNNSRSWYQAPGTKLPTRELKRFQEVRALYYEYTSFKERFF